MIKWSILVGLWAGLSMSARPGAVTFIGVDYIVLIAILAFLRMGRGWMLLVRSMLYSLCSGLSVFYITYPQGWNKWPWESLYDATAYISTRQKGTIASASWQLVYELFQSVPLLYTLGVISLAVITFRRFIGSHRDVRGVVTKSLNNSFSWICLALGLQVVIPVILICLTGTLLYNRLRHILLVFPGLVFFASMGLEMVLTSRNKLSKIVFAPLVSALLIMTLAEVALLSPYQYTYRSDASRFLGIVLNRTALSDYVNNGLYVDYYGASQKRLFSYCIRDKDCLDSLVNDRDAIRQQHGTRADSGAFNQELFEANRLLFLRPKNNNKMTEENGSTKDVYYEFSTNKFKEDWQSNCTLVGSLERDMLVPLSRVSLGSVRKCSGISSNK